MFNYFSCQKIVTYTRSNWDLSLSAVRLQKEGQILAKLKSSITFSAKMAAKPLKPLLVTQSNKNAQLLKISKPMEPIINVIKKTQSKILWNVQT